jgi:cysteine desulfuration protein SufE
MTVKEMIDLFESIDDTMRMDILLDYSRRLPPLPANYQAQMLEGIARVPECMTPVFLWIEKDHRGMLDLHVYVAPEAPTVAGFMGLLREALQGQPVSEAAELPTDLVHQLKLDNLLRMNRTVGLSAMVARIRRQARELM